MCNCPAYPLVGEDMYVVKGRGMKLVGVVGLEPNPFTWTIFWHAEIFLQFKY